MTGADDARRYRINRFLVIERIDEERSAVGDPMRRARLLHGETARILESFRRPQSLDELRARVEAVDPTAVDALFDLFVALDFILPADVDQASWQRARLRARVEHGAQGDERDYSASLVDVGELAARHRHADTIELDVLLLGGCFARFAADALEEVGAASGFRCRVIEGWPSNTELLDAQRPDLVVFQPATVWLLAPLWDEGPFLDDEEFRSRRRLLLEGVRAQVDRLLSRCADRLLLLHGFSTPQLSPWGRSVRPPELSLDAVVTDLNRILIDACRDRPDVMYVDEERLVSNHGKRWLLDDAVVPYAHHGPLFFEADRRDAGGRRRVDSFDAPTARELPALFAREYLSCYLAWSGARRIKLIAVDLDGVLWPGVAGDGGTGLEDPDEALQILHFGVFGGIHQALRLMRQRGVLLATVSKNDERTVLDAWAGFETWAARHRIVHFLRRDDFVLHRINWRRKADNLEEIAEATGVAPDAMLFIDDDPVERAEVAERLGAIRILGEDINHVRGQLLAEPCLQHDPVGTLGAERTVKVRSQLARDRALARAPDVTAFLRRLAIEVTVRRVADHRSLPRLVELAGRTNQFNTSLRRYTPGELGALIDAADASVYEIEVGDRGGHHGIVGLLTIAAGRIECYVLSCRVLTLELAVPTLVGVLREGRHLPVTARIVDGPRNHPCRDVFERAGFLRSGADFVATRDDRLATVDTSVHAIRVIG